jgi:hypothetical protein
MDYLKKLLHWVKQSPKNLIIALVVSILVVVLVILFIGQVLPTLIAIAFFVWLFLGDYIAEQYNKGKISMLSLGNTLVDSVIFNLIYESLTKNKEILSEYVLTPKVIEDIYPHNYRVSPYNGTNIMGLRLQRNGKEITDSDCVFIKNAIHTIPKQNML